MRRDASGGRTNAARRWMTTLRRVPRHTAIPGRAAAFDSLEIPSYHFFLVKPDSLKYHGSRAAQYDLHSYSIHRPYKKSIQTMKHTVYNISILPVEGKVALLLVLHEYLVGRRHLLLDSGQHFVFRAPTRGHITYLVSWQLELLLRLHGELSIVV